jgi:hypothetical protein
MEALPLSLFTQRLVLIKLYLFADMFLVLVLSILFIQDRLEACPDLSCLILGLRMYSSFWIVFISSDLNKCVFNTY